ncbi:MAG: diguanylate cyclase, partial [Pontixanthobacter sp.]
GLHGPQFSNPAEPRWQSGLWRVMREWWRPILAAFVLCSLIISVGPADSSDRRMSDRLLVSQANRADSNIVLIEVDGADIRKYGRPVLSRESFAALVNRIADAKPRRLLIDLHIGERVDPAADAQLERAIARFDPEHLGLVSGARPDELPYPEVAKHGAILDARLTADSDGWHRSLSEDSSEFGNNPAIWFATGEQKRGRVDFDLRIAHWDYPRYSVSDVFDGKAALAGKSIILSASPDVAPTRAYLPLVNEASRTAVLAIAAQSVMQDYASVAKRGNAANFALQLLAILLGFLVALKAETGKRMMVLAVVLIFSLIFANLSIATNIGAAVNPTKTLACFLVMLNVTVVQRLKIVPMVSSFIKGDISPEEAWAWRSCETSTHPALLFAANGRIKRSNQAAKGLVRAHGEVLPGLCLPRFDQRAECLDLDGSGLQTFDVDWPYGYVQIAVLRDNSETELANRELREQLMTDDLTGCTNRRGFDLELLRASRSGEKFVLYFIDMNGFKQVNDEHGHDAGDELLVATSCRLQNLMRKSDVLARLGGDEFAVIMFGADNEQFAKLQRRRMVDAVSHPIRLTATEAVVTVGAAIGYAMPENAEEDVADVLRRADKAMYRNKAALKRIQAAA